MDLRSMLLERNGPPPEVSISEVECRVHLNVEFIQRFLLPVDDDFFYHIVDELLVGEPLAVCMEVKSRLFQLIPIRPFDLVNYGSEAWLPD